MSSKKDKSTMQTLMDYAPTLLLICCGVCFGLMAVFFTDYYIKLFRIRWHYPAFVVGVIIACVKEVIGFALAVTSIRDFAIGKTQAGKLGLIASFSLMFFEIYMAFSVARMWSESVMYQYATIFIFLIVTSRVLEVRMILTWRGEKYNNQKVLSDKEKEAKDKEAAKTDKDKKPGKSGKTSKVKKAAT